ncbi:hypothetical protein K2173_022797 [Erythroxylum novogranatense]|uniref:LysM domain receptor-like kinase 3 n=1 Tax=Erythroxylum novogranatense TaxID=1862640 RepID=A0AAV8SNH3_9ROSI|nr:hypothetical protein K2173_022797 [Erythroxylum novogranatense]
MVSSSHYSHLLIFFYLSAYLFLAFFSTVSRAVFPFNCSTKTSTCNSYLYHISGNYSIFEVASFYFVNTSDLIPISRGLGQDYLVSVPCTCKDVNGTQGYFYYTFYKVKESEMYNNVIDVVYNGQAWKDRGENELLPSGELVQIHLLCGCSEVESQQIVTYTVQTKDTLSSIAELFSAKQSEILKLNKRLITDPDYIETGWVLYVPQEKIGIPDPKQERSYVSLALGLLTGLCLLSITAFLLLLIKRKSTRSHISGVRVALKDLDKCSSSRGTFLQGYVQWEDLKDATFQSDRPLVYSLEEIAEATGDFDHRRKIGEGGYGSVYFGRLNEREVAIKKMKSSRSKEFLAELKILCKIHHINVVELLGYSSGDNHLYLVYEYIQNGSLNDHLHDPLLKGHSPLSWMARAFIAIDAARGIEYIHDHTKTRYVHRDIKTSNILLDQGLRAKVSDFGLARLVERSNEEDLIATCLVGTPGYIAPESVRELQMTSKSDVFAFGVVLAALITGRRSLYRDNKEENNLKALTSVILEIFQDQNPQAALEAVIDSNLKDNYPMEEVYKMAEISRWCLSDEPADRPEMREIVPILSEIVLSSIEWEASIAGSNEEFSIIFEGR